ncbi:MAG TPA: helix-turn-helix domain-containing protein [Nitrososphaeraceae archaeon]|nr:helix-turn-helix domain-containing protein [Nitrososphaeraceae archaeon]
MTRLRNYHQLCDREDIKSCPIDTTFRLVGKKFTILIIREMMRDRTRFNQFLDSIEGINPRIVSARLKEMEKSGLIKRKVYSIETPVRIGYFLTEKGSALKSMLDQMAIFSMRHCAKEVFKDRKPRTLERDLVSTLQ